MAAPRKALKACYTADGDVHIIRDRRRPFDRMSRLGDEYACEQTAGATRTTANAEFRSVHTTQQAPQICGTRPTLRSAIFDLDYFPQSSWLKTKT